MTLRLQEIPDISKQAANVILAEIGPDVRAFPTVKQLASWAGLCPGSYESGGKSKGSRATRGNPYLKATLCRAGLSAMRSNTKHFRSFYHRIASKGSKQKAVVATAHKLLRIIYKLLSTGESYNEHHLYGERKKNSELDKHLEQSN